MPRPVPALSRISFESAESKRQDMCQLPTKKDIRKMLEDNNYSKEVVVAWL